MWLTTRARNSKTSTVSLPAVADASNAHHAYMAWPNEGSLTYTTEKRIEIEADPIEGLMVHKVGRTSGRSVSQVDDECATLTHGTLGWKMLCQILTDDDDAGYGDSGSPVVYPFTGSSYLVAAGLMWGVDTANNVMAASNISYTLDELEDDFGGTLCLILACSPNPSVSFTGPTVIPEDVYCTWQALPSGGVSPYTYVWSGVASGTGSPFEGMVTSSGWLTVTVTDYVSHTAYYSRYITIDENASGEGCAE